MEKANFKQETIEMAQSSQYFIESLWVIGSNVSKLNASLFAVLSSFFGFLISIVDYQLILRKFENQLMLTRLIQGLTLNRIELLIPYYIETEKAILQKAEAFSAQTRKLAIPFLLNLSVVKAASNFPVPLTTRPSELVSFPKKEESDAAKESFEKQVADTPQKTLAHRVVEVQTQLWSKMTPNIQKLSSTLLEYEKQVIPLTFLAAAATSASIHRAAFPGLTPSRFVAFLEGEETKPSFPKRAVSLEGEETKPSFPKRAVSLEGEETKPSFPKPASLEGTREPPVMRPFRIGMEPSDLTGGTTFDPEALMKMGYAVNLSTTIAEKQAPFLEMIAAISRVLASPAAAILRIQGSYEYSRTEPETQPPILPCLIDFRKKRDTTFTSWIHEESKTLQRARVDLLGLPIKASEVESFVTETLIQPISSLQAPHMFRDQKTIPKGLKPLRLKPESKLAPVEAFRIPSILTSLIAYNIQTYPRISSEPTLSHIYESSLEVDQDISRKPRPLGEILEPRKLSKMPIASAFDAMENLLAQRRQKELAVFMKKIQVSGSTYARFMAELIAAGPVRTALLGELAGGFEAPYTIEPIRASTDETSPYTSEPYPSIAGPFSRQSLQQRAPRQNIINVNVSADTAEEDLRDLERKISRILSEQMAELGAVEPIRTALLGELTTGFTTPYKIEINPPIDSSVSRQPFGKGSTRPVSRDTINVNVSADTAEEDLRDLERKISRILSEQISRYYGSSIV